MVGVKSRGRLGNQLFQYAFIYSYAKKHDLPFFIDKFSALSYFKCYEKHYIQNGFNKLRAAYLFIRGSFNFIVQENHQDFSCFPKRDNCIFIGYFQSKTYFEDYLGEIRHLFEVRKKYKIILPQEKYTAVHFRFGDYTFLNSSKLGNDISLPKEYYRKAILEFTNPTEKIIIVSDDIEKAQTYLPERRIYELFHKSEIEDFQILLNAEKLIISNSTYAWWGAMLNENAKIVIAPKHWMGIKIDEIYPKYVFDNLNWELIK